MVVDHIVNNVPRRAFGIMEFIVASATGFSHIDLMEPFVVGVESSVGHGRSMRRAGPAGLRGDLGRWRQDVGGKSIRGAGIYRFVT